MGVGLLTVVASKQNCSWSTVLWLSEVEAALRAGRMLMWVTLGPGVTQRRQQSPRHRTFLDHQVLLGALDHTDSGWGRCSFLPHDLQFQSGPDRIKSLQVQQNHIRSTCNLLRFTSLSSLQEDNDKMIISVALGKRETHRWQIHKIHLHSSQHLTLDFYTCTITYWVEGTKPYMLSERQWNSDSGA